MKDRSAPQPASPPPTAPRHRMTLRGSGTHVSMNSRDSAVCDSQKTTQLSYADASGPPAFSTPEPVVRASSSMPPGYSFVPKGDLYVTRNCRQRTRQAHQVVYAVVNDKKIQIGIQVPLLIHAAVLKSASATRGHRQLITKKRDEDLEKRFREAILARFPRIPPEERRLITRHATKKGEGRVGRTGRKEMAEKAYLATQAHIRHTKTNYEDLLRSGTNREAARVLTAPNIFGVLTEWGPVTTRRNVETARKQIPTESSQRTRGGATLLKSTAKTPEGSARARQANRTMAVPYRLRRTGETTIVSPANAAKGASVTSLATPASVGAVMRRNRSKRREHHERRRAKRRLGTQD
ncbi:hypothetical protein F4782DRAFT_378508 [Xylaria castorea]|nr:hypothetical protein F4782DRAFT_378508 [Xylaria castorea]